MEEADGEAELVGDLPDVLEGVGLVVVVLQEVEHTLACVGRQGEKYNRHARGNPNVKVGEIRRTRGKPSYLGARSRCTGGRGSQSSRTSGHTNCFPNVVVV